MGERKTSIFFFGRGIQMKHVNYSRKLLEWKVKWKLY